MTEIEVLRELKNKMNDLYLIADLERRWYLWGEAIRKCNKSLSKIPEKSVSAQDEKDDGWIEWDGGDMPVKGNAFVDVKFVEGDTVKNSLAVSWRWLHDNKSSDIIAYRVVRP